MDFRIDNHFAALVPLHEQRFVPDLAATDPIDREVSEKRTGAKVAQRSPQLLVIEAGTFLKRRYGNQACRVCLSGWVIAPKVWIGEAETTREIGRGRAKFPFDASAAPPIGSAL